MRFSVASVSCVCMLLLEAVLYVGILIRGAGLANCSLIKYTWLRVTGRGHRFTQTKHTSLREGDYKTAQASQSIFMAPYNAPPC